MSDVTIHVRDSGPLVVRGPVEIVDADGKAFQVDAAKPNVALCRCGHSKKRPFCDGSHRSAEFDAVDRASKE